MVNCCTPVFGMSNDTTPKMRIDMLGTQSWCTEILIACITMTAIVH